MQGELTKTLTAHEAKRLLREELERRGLRRGVHWTALKARTVGFSDLARASCVFVDVPAFSGGLEAWDELRIFARQNGFRLGS